MRPGETDPNKRAAALFDGLPQRYDALAALLSLGQDRRWRREMVSHIPIASPRLILDVATGPGGVAFALRRHTGASVVGVDLTWPMLIRARQNIARADAHGIFLTQARGEQLPFRDGTFDAVTFTYLLRYVADPMSTIAELARVLRPGGVLANLEFLRPASPLWRGLWWCYTRGLLPAAGLVTGGREWWSVGRFLGPSISTHYKRYPVEWTVDAWKRAGLSRIGIRKMSLGGGLVMWGTRASADEADQGTPA